MITVYLTTRGDICYKCSSCDHAKQVFTEFRDTPFWDHYNGIVIRDMINHYIAVHATRKQVSTRHGNGHPSDTQATQAHAWGGL